MAGEPLDREDFVKNCKFHRGVSRHACAKSAKLSRRHGFADWIRGRAKQADYVEAKRRLWEDSLGDTLAEVKQSEVGA
jgi:hypothetical protein